MTEDEILQFVQASFRSVWPLELLLLLSRDAAREWQVNALVRELRASIPAIVSGLAALEAVQLVSLGHERVYRYQPASAEHDELVRALLDLYQRKPQAVRGAIFSAPTDRIQLFADAFRLRKDSC